MSTIMQPSLFRNVSETPSRRRGPAEVTGLVSDHILTPARGRLQAYDYSLNPYRGCGFGCSYCYAANFVPEPERRETWGKWVEVKEQAVSLIRRRDIAGRRIYMSSATDPYQPIELEQELTRGLLEEMVRQQPRLVIQTRGPLVTRDIEILLEFRHLRVNLSITTDSNAVRKRYEPHCASIERRLAAAEMLVASGIQVGVCVSPMLPMEDPGGFGRRLRQIGVHKVGASWFHESDRAFAATTRDGAKELLAEDGWTYGRYLRAKDAISLSCLAFLPDDNVFLPA